MKEKEWKVKAVELAHDGLSWRNIAKELGVAKSTVSDFLRKEFKGATSDLNTNPHTLTSKTKQTQPRVLFLDIETSQMLMGGWGLWNQNYSIEQIEKDWDIISYAAKWRDEDDVMYNDISEDTEDVLLEELWNLLNEADIVIAHNGRKFDLKKIRARMIIKGFLPYSPVRVIDTLEVCKKEFGFTSNKLAYLTQTLCKTHIKSTHNKFPGYVLWSECLKGNTEAFDEMRSYNQVDVTSLSELYDIISPWSSTLPVFEVYTDDVVDNEDWVSVGYHYSNLGKYQKYRNVKTGQWRRGRVNLLSKEKRASLLANIV